MTWCCPSCDRTYPDSSLGVPAGAPHADAYEACTKCVDELCDDVNQARNGVPKEDLRELVEELQEKEDWYRMQAIKKGDSRASGKAKAYRECVGEIKALLQDHE